METGTRFVSLGLPAAPFHQSSQFSTRKPGTLSKSERLADKRSAWLTRAVAAIFRSLEPMRSFCRRRSSNCRAAASSHGRGVSFGELSPPRRLLFGLVRRQAFVVNSHYGQRHSRDLRDVGD